MGKRLARLIQTGFFHSNIKVHVVEKDITKTQKKVASIRAKATIIGGK